MGIIVMKRKIIVICSKVMMTIMGMGMEMMMRMNIVLVKRKCRLRKVEKLYNMPNRENNNRVTLTRMMMICWMIVIMEMSVSNLYV